VGRTDEAMAYVRQIHDGYKDRVRPSQTAYAARWGLAESLKKAGLTAEAITEYEMVRAWWAQWYPDHPIQGPTGNNLAELYCEVGHMDDGFALFESITYTSQGRWRGFGGDTSIFLANWLDVLEQDNQSRHASEILQEYIAAARKALGADETRLVRFLVD